MCGEAPTKAPPKKCIKARGCIPAGGLSKKFPSISSKSPIPPMDLEVLADVVVFKLSTFGEFVIMSGVEADSAFDMESMTYRFLQDFRRSH